ncbi:MAG: hypothetical protein ACUVRN_05020 [Candidatus Caldatribacteriaceae bacterium]
MEIKRKAILALFLLSCGTFLWLFSLWAQKQGFLSPEMYFFSFFAHHSSGERITNLFLTYPPIPFLLSLLYPSILSLPVITGVLCITFSTYWLFDSEPVLFILFILNTILSPLFLFSLCASPTLLLFFIFLLSSIAHLIWHQERQSVYHLFLGGIFLGVAFLSYPRIGWFVGFMILFAIVFLSESPAQKISLPLVILFPTLSFFLSLAFLNWVHANSAFSFFHASYSFLPHLPSFALQNWKETLVQFPRWIFFSSPLLVTILSDTRRFFWGVAILLTTTLLPFFLPLLGTILIFSTGFLKTTSPKRIHRSLLWLSLTISSIAGWVIFFLVPSQFFPFPPYTLLQEKLINYQKIRANLSTSGLVLIADQDYFLVSSWEKQPPLVTPQEEHFQTISSNPFAFCEYIVSSTSRPFPGFQIVLQDKTLILYQRKKETSSNFPNGNGHPLLNYDG